MSITKNEDFLKHDENSLKSMGVLIQKRTYRKDRKLPLKNGKFLTVEAGKVITFYKYGKLISLTKRKIYQPMVDPRHIPGIFKDFSEEQIKASDKVSPLHKAAEDGNLSVFQSYIENMLSAEIVITEDVNPEDDKGQTPLHLAARNGHLEICRLILANVNDKNPVNHDGETPSQLAAYHGHLPVMELIKSALSKKGSRFNRTVVCSYAEALEGNYLGQ